MTTPTENVVAELRAKADAFERCYDRTMRVHELLVAIDQAAALIESQRATIEKRDLDFAIVDGLRRAAEARVTALEAEKAEAVKLADGYGIVLMMIAAGCSDPQRFAKRMLAEYAPEAKKNEATK